MMIRFFARQMTTLSLLMPLLVSVGASAAFAAKPQASAQPGVIISADGEFSGNHPAQYIAKILMPVNPQYGDSDISVRTEVKTVGDQLHVLIKGETARGRKVDINLQCGLYKVTEQRATLFVGKKKQTPELQNGGISVETVIQASCADSRQPGTKFSAFMNYDADAYTLIIDRGDLARFDVIIGEMPKK